MTTVLVLLFLYFAFNLAVLLANSSAEEFQDIFFGHYESLAERLFVTFVIFVFGWIFLLIDDQSNFDSKL